MKRILSSVIIVALVMLAWPMNSHAADSYFQTGFHYDFWASDEDDSGMQFYLPIEVGTKINDISLRVLGSYAYTEVDLSGGQKESLSNFTDTKVNLSYELLDQYDFDLLFGLGFNLPTGYTDLRQSELALVLPPDLISITTFGEGLNVNPTIVITRQWEDWVAGIGLGYTWRDKYDYSTDVQDYDPGDIFSTTFEIRHDLSTTWQARVFGEYLSYGKDEADGNEFYQEGTVWLIGFGAGYDRSMWDLDFNLMSIFRDKSKITDGAGLPTEKYNSHGDEWIGDLTYRYFMTDETTLQAGLQILWIDSNEYPSASPYYIGTRQKITLGCGMTRSFRPDITGALTFRGFYMDDEKNWYHPLEDLQYTGFSLGGTISCTF